MSERAYQRIRGGLSVAAIAALGGLLALSHKDSAPVHPSRVTSDSALFPENTITQVSTYHQTLKRGVLTTIQEGGDGYISVDKAWCDPRTKTFTDVSYNGQFQISLGIEALDIYGNNVCQNGVLDRHDGYLDPADNMGMYTQLSPNAVPQDEYVPQDELDSVLG